MLLYNTIINNKLLYNKRVERKSKGRFGDWKDIGTLEIINFRKHLSNS